MASERSKRRDFLACIFITKSISKKLLIKMCKVVEKFLRTPYSQPNIFVFMFSACLQIVLGKQHLKQGMDICSMSWVWNCSLRFQ